MGVEGEEGQREGVLGLLREAVDDGVEERAQMGVIWMACVGQQGSERSVDRSLGGILFGDDERVERSGGNLDQTEQQQLCRRQGRTRSPRCGHLSSV